MKKSLFNKLLFSIKEAKGLGLKINESFCCFCERDLPNKSYITDDGCLWCDPKGDINGKRTKKKIRSNTKRIK